MKIFFDFISTFFPCLECIPEPEPEETVPFNTEEDFTRYISVLGEECQICIEAFKKIDFEARQIIQHPCCKQHYHKTCLTTWRIKQPTCPNCRAETDYEMTCLIWNSYLEEIHPRVVEALKECEDVEDE
jgi:hypothetical protein